MFFAIVSTVEQQGCQGAHIHTQTKLKVCLCLTRDKSNLLSKTVFYCSPLHLLLLLNNLPYFNPLNHCCFHFLSDCSLPVSAAAGPQWGAPPLRPAPQVTGLLCIHSVPSATSQLHQLQGPDWFWPWTRHRHGSEEPRGKCWW